MQSIYQSKYGLIRGKTYADKVSNARAIYNRFVRQTKRRAYVKSAYFNKRKVFLSLFWEHLAQKWRRERERRIVFYGCALDLIRNSLLSPEITMVKGENEVLYRFFGRSKEGHLFAVQIKQNNRDERHHISVFPLD